MCGRQIYHGIDRRNQVIEIRGVLAKNNNWLNDIVVGDGDASNDNDDGDDDDVRDSGGVTE